MADKTAIEQGLVSACPNHPDRAATIRCDSCLRPVCDECLVRDGNAKYCSAKCLEGAQVTRDRVEDLANRPPAPRNAPVVSIIVFGLLVIGGIYVWQHWAAVVKLYHHYVK